MLGLPQPKSQIRNLLMCCDLEKSDRKEANASMTTLVLRPDRAFDTKPV